MPLGAYHYDVPETRFRNPENTSSSLAHWELGMLSKGWAGNISEISCLLMGCHIDQLILNFLSPFNYEDVAHLILSLPTACPTTKFNGLWSDPREGVLDLSTSLPSRMERMERHSLSVSTLEV